MRSAPPTRVGDVLYWRDQQGRVVAIRARVWDWSLGLLPALMATVLLFMFYLEASTPIGTSSGGITALVVAVMPMSLALAFWLNRVRVRITGPTVTITSGPIPWPRTTRLECGSVVGIVSDDRATVAWVLFAGLMSKGRGPSGPTPTRLIAKLRSGEARVLFTASSSLKAELLRAGIAEALGLP